MPLDLPWINQPLCMYERGNWLTCSSIPLFTVGDTHFNHAYLLSMGWWSSSPACGRFPSCYGTVHNGNAHMQTSTFITFTRWARRLVTFCSLITGHQVWVCSHVINAVEMENGMRMAGGAFLRVQWGDTRKYIIRTLYGELFHVHCSLIIRREVVSCHLKINS